ncbi:MAG: hypothetical protein ACRC2T_04345, partial [Thermoguttaceae bacterium]
MILKYTLAVRVYRSVFSRFVFTSSLILFCVCWNNNVLAQTPYNITSIGDWASDSDDDSTLAGAMYLSTSGDTIVLSSDPGTNWTNWPSSGGYTILRHATASANTSLIFDLNQIGLSGVSFDIQTGTGVFTFQNGTLGTSSNNFAVGFGANSQVLLNDVELTAAALQLGSDTTSGTLKLGGNSSVSTTGTFSVLNGSLCSSSSTDTATTIGGNFLVSGVSVIETAPGSFTYMQSKLSGSGGILNFNGDVFTVSNGAEVDLSGFSNFSGTGYSVNTGKTLNVDGVMTHSGGAKSFQSKLNITGPLNIEGGTVNISGGGHLRGVTSVNIAGSGAVNVSGAIRDADSGKSYQSNIEANGGLVIGETGAGTLNVKDGGLISGVTDITVGNGETGTLAITGMDAATNFRSMIAATGALLVGDGAAGNVLVDG